jgi:alkylated DNA repair dioxygenase AlkB
MTRTELRDDAWVDFDDTWLPAEEASAIQAELVDQVVWEHRAIKVFGREILQPRLVGWAGELPYRYSSQTLEPRACGPALRGVWDAVNARVGVPFNHVLLNLYRDGHDKMSLHADNEPELGRNPTIASISLGAERRFRVVPKDKRARRKETRTWRLTHGSLLVMGGRMQHTWRHEVPGMNSVKEPRVNLTFRVLHGPPGWRGD